MSKSFLSVPWVFIPYVPSQFNSSSFNTLNASLLCTPWPMPSNTQHHANIHPEFSVPKPSVDMISNVPASSNQSTLHSSNCSKMLSGFPTQHPLPPAVTIKPFCVVKNASIPNDEKFVNDSKVSPIDISNKALSQSNVPLLIMPKPGYSCNTVIFEPTEADVMSRMTKDEKKRYRVRRSKEKKRLRNPSNIISAKKPRRSPTKTSTPVSIAGVHYPVTMSRHYKNMLSRRLRERGGHSSLNKPVLPLRKSVPLSSLNEDTSQRNQK